MIAELDRYQGVVLRQLLVASGRAVLLGTADVSGRVDAYRIGGAGFQIKHSTKRMSPWRFTYLFENLNELKTLQSILSPIWVFLVCGQDGVVGLSLEELESIVEISPSSVGWVRVSRSKNAMYRVGGALGDLTRAKPRGVDQFLAAIDQAPGPEQTL